MAQIEEETPFTELSNDITANIDIADADSIFDLLHQCNAETFKGNSNPFCNGILNNTCINQCANISKAIVEIIFSELSTGKIILSGCGTSGRIGFMVVRAFNRILESLSLPQCYEYLIAGKDRSLFISQEAKEDEWDVAANELEMESNYSSRVVYFGITCGLSAPYVAGQLNYCLHGEKEKFIPVLLGFNPVSLARKTTFPGLGKSFYDVALELEKLEGKGAFILNPVVGAEPITGSSRMKGGTATKILLESIFLTAHIKAGHILSSLSNKTYFELIQFFIEKIYFQAYEQFPSYKSQIVPVIQSCADSLIKKTPQNESGHIYYVADGTFGLLGLIDTSECPPTFGTEYSTVRGFLNGAYTTLGNNEGDLEAKYGDFYAISWQHFENIIPTLHMYDTVIFLICELEEFGYTKQMISQVQRTHCQLYGLVREMPEVKCYSELLNLLKDNSVIIRKHSISLSSPDLLNMSGVEFFEEMILKWILNAVTTGAHILQGKILKNFMIDVQPTNSKLFDRSVDIVRRFSNTTAEMAREALISAIYQTDDPSKFILADVGEHIAKATTVKKVVPTAILIASWKLSVSNANKYLETHPVLRNAILAYNQEN